MRGQRSQRNKVCAALDRIYSGERRLERRLFQNEIPG